MKLAPIVSGLLVALSLTACGTSQVPTQTAENHDDALDTVKVLEAADSFDLKKEALSIGDDWTVSVDGIQVATIKGLQWKAIGDVYTILSPEGGFVAGEDQEIFTISNTSDFYDIDQAKTGQLRKDVVALLATYRLKDVNGNGVATLNQNMALTLNGAIKDSEGEDSWKFNKALLSWGASIHMEKVNDNVSALDAIRMVAVANEVSEQD